MAPASWRRDFVSQVKLARVEIGAGIVDDSCIVAAKCRAWAAASGDEFIGGEMSQVSDNLLILEELAQAFNAHDLDQIMELFAEDCSLDMPRGSAPWGTRYVGKVEVREGLRTRFQMLPDVHYGDVRHFATETMGVSEWLLTGTLLSGKTIAVRGCDHYELRDGKVVRKDSYWKIVE
jgi:ketosteroid isomerase-like protein